jgi:hypothetical protein
MKARIAQHNLAGHGFETHNVVPVVPIRPISTPSRNIPCYIFRVSYYTCTLSDKVCYGNFTEEAPNAATLYECF